tara:strand:+ start:1105 stop:1302 length:198 start_codon:yes stop_codon:yes gene_type:complete
MANAHNLNNAIEVSLEKNGITEIKQLMFKPTEEGTLIEFNDQMERKIQVNITVPRFHKPSCCNCK